MWSFSISLTSWVVASVLQTLQTFEEDLKDLTASPRHMVVEIGEDSWGAEQNVKIQRCVPPLKVCSEVQLKAQIDWNARQARYIHVTARISGYLSIVWQLAFSAQSCLQPVRTPTITQIECVPLHVDLRNKSD